MGLNRRAREVNPSAIDFLDILDLAVRNPGGTHLITRPSDESTPLAFDGGHALMVSGGFDRENLFRALRELNHAETVASLRSALRLVYFNSTGAVFTAHWRSPENGR